MRLYDKNLTISLDDTSYHLAKLELAEEKIPTEHILIKFDASKQMMALSGTDKKALGELTGYSHLYINAHGIYGVSDFIADCNDNLVHFNDVTNLITQYVKNNTLTGLRITLNICYAAEKFPFPTPTYAISKSAESQFLPTTQYLQASFADLLQMSLWRRGMGDISIVACRGIVTQWYNDTSSSYYKYTENELNHCFIALQNLLHNLNQENAYPLEIKLRFIQEVNFHIDTLFHQMKKLNQSRPYQKVLFFLNTNNYPVSADYYQVKTWEKSIEQFLTVNASANMAVEFNQKRTYKDKLFFLFNSHLNSNPIPAELAIEASTCKPKKSFFIDN